MVLYHRVVDVGPDTGCKGAHILAVNAVEFSMVFRCGNRSGEGRTGSHCAQLLSDGPCGALFPKEYGVSGDGVSREYQVE
jgi:hypothetical protein